MRHIRKSVGRQKTIDGRRGCRDLAAAFLHGFLSGGKAVKRLAGVSQIAYNRVSSRVEFKGCHKQTLGNRSLGVEEDVN